MINKPFQYQQGMTLLEVLIAIGILAVISAMAFISIDNMVKSKASIDQHTNQLNQTNLTFQLLQNDLQFAVTGNQLNGVVKEFIGTSQNLTLLRYVGQTVTSARIESLSSEVSQSLKRVRWFIRGKQLFRAVQSAHLPIQGQNWQERPMMAVKSMACNYRNAAGIDTSVWPNKQQENSQLPVNINCLLTTEQGLETSINIVPWQAIW